MAINWHYGDGHGNPHPTKNDWAGTFSTPDKQAQFEALTTEVQIGNDLHHPGTYINFGNEPGLTAISLPKVKIVEGAAFYHSPLIEVHLPEVIEIANGAFSSASLTEFDFPKLEVITSGISGTRTVTWVNLPSLRFFTAGNKVPPETMTEVVNAPTTTVILPNIFNDEAFLDKMFNNHNGPRRWEKIKFIWVGGPNQIIYGSSMQDTQFDWNGKIVAKFVWVETGKECVLKVPGSTGGGTGDGTGPANWKEFNTSGTPKVAMSDDGTVALAGTSHFWRSTDSGANMIQTDPADWERSGYMRFAKTGPYVFANPQNSQDSLVSPDKGVTWTSYRTHIDWNYLALSDDGKYGISGGKLSQDYLHTSTELTVSGETIEHNGAGVSGDGTVIVVATDQPRYKSSYQVSLNHGKDWTSPHLAAGEASGVSLVSKDGSVIVALHNSGLAVTKNKGQTWTEHAPVGTGNGFKGGTISSDGMHIVVYGGYGVAYSENGGDTWAISKGIGGAPTMRGDSSLGGKIVIIGADGYDGRASISTNFGKTFAVIPNVHGVYDVQVSNSGNNIIIGTYGNSAFIGTP